MIPRRRLELERGEHLLELPVFGLLPLAVRGQLVLEKVRRGGGGGGAPAGERRRCCCHLIAVLHAWGGSGSGLGSNSQPFPH